MASMHVHAYTDSYLGPKEEAGRETAEISHLDERPGANRTCEISCETGANCECEQLQENYGKVQGLILNARVLGRLI